MKHGLIIASVGAAVYLAAATLLPWQRFELAEVAPTGLALGPLAWLALVVTLGLGVGAVVGLAQRKYVMAGRIIMIGGLGLAAWLALAYAHRTWDFRLMAYEHVAMGAGFVLAVLGVCLVAGGGAATLLAAPTWDEATPVVRATAKTAGAAEREIIIYEPRAIAFERELGHQALGAIDARLTPEGEVHLAVPSHVDVVAHEGARAKRGDMRRILLNAGDIATLAVSDVTLRIDYVKQRRHVTRRLVLRVEAVVLALAAVLTLLGTGVVSVLSANDEPIRLWPSEERRVATFAALTQEEKRDDEVELAIETAIVEATSAKAAGGPEGRLGDENAPPEMKTKVPPREGRMVEKFDMKKVGLLEVMTDPRMDSAVADIMENDGSFAAKLAVATAGSDDSWAVGPGTNGVGFKGDGDGGPGDGTGRLQGLGPIDTGPGSAPRATVALVPREKVRVPKVDMPAPAIGGGFCKRQEIESVVRRRAGTIRACYEQRLQVKDGLKGKITVQWTIGTEGLVSAANASVDTLGDPAVSSCVFRAVRNMRFQPPEGGVCVVQWPFIFNPG